MSASGDAESDFFRESQITQLGFYIGLKEGKELNLRVAANAALCFDDFLRAFMEEVEPNAPVEITLVKGDTGSLNLVSSLRAKVSKRTLAAAVVFASGWIGGHIAEYTFNSILDYITRNLTEEQKIELTQADIERIAAACTRAANSSAVIDKKEEITETLLRDESVTGVGVTLGSEVKPRHILPRAQFYRSSFLLEELQVERIGGDTRIVQSMVDLILTEPVLIDKPRKWRFLFGRQEISASISDEVFRYKALQGKLGVQISQGIIIRAILLTTEERLETNLWKPINYDVRKVISWRSEPTQMSLIPPGAEE